jgi:hypothetical protein
MSDVDDYCFLLAGLVEAMALGMLLPLLLVLRKDSSFIIILISWLLLHGSCYHCYWR